MDTLRGWSAVRHVADATGDEYFMSALNLLAARIEQHIVEEETTLVPFLCSRLDDAEQRQLAQRMAETVAEVANADWLGAAAAQGA